MDIGSAFYRLALLSCEDYSEIKNAVRDVVKSRDLVVGWVEEEVEA